MSEIKTITGYFAGISDIFKKKPDALAVISGSPQYNSVKGMVQFYQTRYGVIVASAVIGLPFSEDKCVPDVFAFHIHEGDMCTGDINDPFADAKMHYNPYNCQHPQHAGDLLPLMGNQGYAFSAFLSNRFNVDEIIGKTIIIHAGVDDFTTQPAGNAGDKIACGVIV